MPIIQKPSPNFNTGRKETTYLVIHATASDNANGALNHLTNPHSGVSAHYLIDRTGIIYQLVEEKHVAFHAGISEWNGVKDLNDKSIGIELTCGPSSPYPKEEIDAAVLLCQDIIQRYAIKRENVVRHSDIAPGRKSDPFPLFPWEEFKKRLYPDVLSQVSPWALPAWNWGLSKGLLTPGVSQPKSLVTKEELLTILHRYDTMKKS